MYFFSSFELLDIYGYNQLHGLHIDKCNINSWFGNLLKVCRPHLFKHKLTSDDLFMDMDNSARSQLLLASFVRISPALDKALY